MKIKYLAATLILAVFLVGGASSVKAQTSSSTNEILLKQIQTLLTQVKTLQDQITTLNNQRGQLQTELRETMQLTRTLTLGMTGDDVKLLQEMLATDPEIYPERLVTGFFGPLTERAVKRFQKKNGFEEVGFLGPKTRARINGLVASTSAALPPGLQKKVGWTASSTASTTCPNCVFGINLNDQKVTICHYPGGNASNRHTLVVAFPALQAHLAHGDTVGACSGVVTTPEATTTPPTVDSTPPLVSSLAAVGTASTTAYVSWTTNELATSTLWYETANPVSTSTAAKLENNDWKTIHSYNISNLAASTTYYYSLELSDKAGNKTSAVGSFVTQ